MTKPDWITLSKDSGSGNDTVQVICSVNPEQERTAQINIGTSKGITKVLSVIQKENLSGISIDPFEMILKSTNDEYSQIVKSTITVPPYSEEKSPIDVYYSNEQEITEKLTKENAVLAVNFGYTDETGDHSTGSDGVALFGVAGATAFYITFSGHIPFGGVGVAPKFEFYNTNGDLLVTLEVSVQIVAIDS